MSKKKISEEKFSTGHAETTHIFARLLSNIAKDNESKDPISFEAVLDAYRKKKIPHEPREPHEAYVTNQNSLAPFFDQNVDIKGYKGLAEYVGVSLRTVKAKVRKGDWPSDQLYPGGNRYFVSNSFDNYKK